MINRRIIRTKVLQVLYAFQSNEEKSIAKAEKELLFSFQKTHDLYHYVLQLVVDISNHALEVIERRKNKHFPTSSDLNPKLSFVNNQVISLLRQNSALAIAQATSKLSWSNEPELIASLYKELEANDFYLEYMAKESVTFNDDKRLIEVILSEIILQSESLEAILEEQSVYWNDDLDYVVNMLMRTISKNFKTKSDANTSLMPMFRDIDDREFAINIFRKTLVHDDELKKIVQQYTKNWDIERLAIIDTLLMKMAICELLYFPSIPTKVTLNEYIEIAKHYSTQKSKTFINGILDKVLKSLTEEDRIKKVGRGLIE